MRNLPAFVSGIMVGAVLGLSMTPLLFPDYGKGFKRRLKAYWDELLDEARQAAEAKMAELEAEYEELTGLRA